MIAKEGSYWVVKTKDGKKVLGKHRQRKKAVKQLQAIEISKHENNITRVLDILSEKKVGKDINPADIKPRILLPPNKVEIDDKTKQKNPRKFDKHKKKIVESKRTKYDDIKKWKAAVKSASDGLGKGFSYIFQQPNTKSEYMEGWIAKWDPDYEISDYAPFKKIGEWDGYEGWVVE